MSKKIFAHRWKNIILKCLICTLLSAVAVALILRPVKYLSCCFEGLCLWAECVLPSLFPFMVICLLLIKMGAPEAIARPFKGLSALHLPQCALPLTLMSAVSGYPAGSRMVSEFYDCGKIDEWQAKKLAPICSTCGPLFALGTVGGKAFGGGGAGVKLLVACLVSVIATSLAYCALGKDSGAPSALKLSPKREQNALYSAFYGAVTASLVAGGFICFFYTVSQIVADFCLLAPLNSALALVFGDGLAHGVCLGLIEATGGCFALAGAGGFFALPLAGFLITFGGASILLQQYCYLQACKVKAGFFFAFKFVQAVICFALLCLFNLF